MAENVKNTNRITGVTVSNLPEGTRLTFTYCVLDGAGNTLESNKRDSFVILDSSVLEAANTVFTAAKEHLESEAK